MYLSETTKKTIRTYAILSDEHKNVVNEFINNPNNQTFLRTVNYFVLYEKPQDAFLVIKKENVAKLSYQLTPNPNNDETRLDTRTTLTASRFIWLLCKTHPDIGPELIDHPYKLVNLIEYWARESGIKDNIHGETLKKMLLRGKPQ